MSEEKKNIYQHIFKTDSFNLNFFLKMIPQKVLSYMKLLGLGVVLGVSIDLFFDQAKFTFIVPLLFIGFILIKSLKK